MRILRLIVLSLILGVFAPGMAQALPWSWDMYTQPSHKAQEEPALALPQGTVPVDGKPLAVKDRPSAAELKNPIPPTTESLDRGRERYNIYCATCHGETGKGDGPVGKKYIPPTDLSGDYVQNKPGGDIYYTITYGGLAIMPSYSDSVEYKDRWHIVNYIQNVLGKKAAKEAEK